MKTFVADYNAKTREGYCNGGAIPGCKDDREL